MAGIDSIAEKNIGNNKRLLKTEIEDDDICIEYKHPPELNGPGITINVPTQPKTIVTTEDDFNLDGFIFKSDIKIEGATLQKPDIGRRNLAPITYDASDVTTRLKDYERRPLRSGRSNIINDDHLKKLEIRLEKLSEPIRRPVPLSNVRKSTGSENSSHLNSTKGGVKSPKKLVSRVYPVKKLMVRVEQLSYEVLNKHLTNVIAKSATRQEDDLEKRLQIRERCLSLKHQRQTPTPTNSHKFECYICHYVGASIESQLKQHMQKHTFAFGCSICQKTFLRKGLLTVHQQRHTALRQFQCKICLRKSKTKADLKRHLNIHLDYKPFECSVCSRKFRFESTLRDHQRLHSGEKPFSCPHCPKKCSQKSSLRYHLLTHTGERKYSCDCCSMTFLVLRHLKIHRVTHTGEKLFQCTVIGCLKKFGRMSSLVQHRRTHTGERPYTCNHKDCSKSFSAKSGLRKHERTHTKEKPFQCSDCSKKFAQQYRLKVHRRTHTGEKPYSCDHCSMSFADRNVLNNHRRIHTGEKPYACPHCPDKFARLSTLIDHQSKHSERTHACTDCSKTFTSKTLLKIHKRTHLEYSYSCDHCSIKFRSNESLNKHRRNDNPFECIHCDEKHLWKCDFKKHLETHANVKRFECNLCSKRFLLNSLLNKHKRIHSGIRPYSCGDCPMKFITGAQLNRHIRRHTGEKPFKCTKCSDTFARSDSLKSHMQRIHMINISNHKTKSMSQKPKPKIYECYICRFRGAATKQELQNHIRIHSQDLD